MIKEPGASCDYCLKVVGKHIDAVGKLYQWDDLHKIKRPYLFCREHYIPCKKEMEKSIRAFLGAYKSSETRNRLSKESLKLYYFLRDKYD